ncbi:MAG TPA: heavy metal-associated domain-containing protein [Bryobacteraceae bacterium]|jgi:copper chaperone CopZ
MFRRRFIQNIALAGTGSLAGGETRRREEVVYRVQGFTCVTCAVGLETLLRRQKGVTRAEASYPSGIVRIEFDPTLLTDKVLREFISEMGFTVAEKA